MISKVSGKVELSGLRFVVINTGPVAYKIFIPAHVLKTIKTGNEVSLWTYLHVREDAMELYGFLEYPELDFFEMLIQIPGIGPKSALGVLSVAPLDTLKHAVSAGEIEYLTKVSGIGRKTAEKIILELREKLGRIDLGEKGKALLEEDEDVIQALASLGYSAREAREAIKNIPKEIAGASNRVKEALNKLNKK